MQLPLKEDAPMSSESVTAPAKAGEPQPSKPVNDQLIDELVGRAEGRACD